MATKKTTEEVNVEVKETPKVDPFEELVPFMAFKDSGKYSEDLTVCINGKTWKIQRGKQVMIPKKVLYVIEQSIEQDGFTADFITREGNKVSGDNFYR